jgi:secondary thiamine-phosphate synthase enzyme
MPQALHRLQLQSRGRGLSDFTDAVRDFVATSGIRQGLLTVFCRHTSASLIIQENADPSVQRDLERFFAKLVKDGDPAFEHDLEGPDDMPAHIRSALTQTSLSIPVCDGRMVLGTWQGIYLYEHRHRGHTREVVLHLIGD